MSFQLRSGPMPQTWIFLIFRAASSVTSSFVPSWWMVIRTGTCCLYGFGSRAFQTERERIFSSGSVCSAAFFCEEQDIKKQHRMASPGDFISGNLCNLILCRLAASSSGPVFTLLQLAYI